MSYYLVDLNNFSHSPEERGNMAVRLCSASEKLKNHILNCRIINCDICKKTKVWIDTFIVYEKKTNKTLNFQEIIEYLVDGFLFSNDQMSIIY